MWTLALHRFRGHLRTTREDTPHDGPGQKDPGQKDPGQKDPGQKDPRHEDADGRTE